MIEAMIYFGIETLQPHIVQLVAMSTGFVLVLYVAIIHSMWIFNTIIGRKSHAGK